MEFPYPQIKPNVFAPIVKIELFNSRIWFSFDAYVDSGASYSIFGKEVATVLGLDFTKGKRIFVTVGDGGIIPVYLHKMRVRFADEEFKATIGFSDKLGVEFNLLGRVDFFEKFKICFNDRDKSLTTELLG